MASDYLMRQIEDMARFLASMITARKPENYSVIEEDGGISEGNLLRFQLRALLQAGNVNGAENLLFNTVRANPREEFLPVALDFYEALRAMPDTELSAAGFSRQEIAEGLEALYKLYVI